MSKRSGAEHLGWNSRGYLPHFDSPGKVQSVNFRLADSLPVEKLAELKVQLSQTDDPEVRDKLETLLDAGHGSCVLRNPPIGMLVENALRHFDGQRYALLAWAVMPNHVHVLFQTMPEHPLRSVLHSWKSYTASEANKILNGSGRFWAEDYWDRYMRDDRHLCRETAYIEDNPVKAGLVPRPELWPWSSARFRMERA